MYDANEPTLHFDDIGNISIGDTMTKTKLSTSCVYHGPASSAGIEGHVDEQHNITLSSDSDSLFFSFDLPVGGKGPGGIKNVRMRLMLDELPLIFNEAATRIPYCAAMLANATAIAVQRLLENEKNEEPE